MKWIVAFTLAATPAFLTGCSKNPIRAHLPAQMAIYYGELTEAEVTPERVVISNQPPAETMGSAAGRIEAYDKKE